jgi:ANTAR domain-containing protein/GAF domain-containing protein
VTVSLSVNRRLRLWHSVVGHAAGTPVTLENVCAIAMSMAGVDGATIVVLLASQHRETVYVSDPVVSDIEDLVETLGEGPGFDAGANGPVLVADLATAESAARWPSFATAATASGVRAAFGLPLHVGGIRLGVMDLYRSVPGPLNRDQLADALILADAVCTLLLDSAATNSGGEWFEQAGPHHPEVHQATGIVMVQLGVSAAVAFVRLRAYAFANDRRLRDVAADVVARQLRLEPEFETGQH